MGERSRLRPFVLLAVLVALGACTDGTSDAPRAMDATDQPRVVQAAPPPEADQLMSAASVTVHAVPEFAAAAAFETVDYLAGEIGPREGTSPAFHEAADWVEDQFAELGYDVTQVEVPVARGQDSYRPEWGTVVEPGTSANVIADSSGFDQSAPHVVIGAHLDTVGVAPGAEDNASGVAVVLELARLAAEVPPGLPVRFIAFGAEEPRGTGNDLHHFGSQQYVRDLPNTDKAQVVAMVALDRVGVPSSSVPICSAGLGTTDTRDELVAAADAVDIDSHTCENLASDHVAFDAAGIPAARMGSVPYDGYHSAGDVPNVVDAGQLDRVGTIVWHWLQAVS
jgi:hypothetical protein